MAAYDYQAHGEQIRHSQIAADAARELREEEAVDYAPIALAEMDGNDLAAIGNALNELPKKIADPLILKINAQLQAQTQGKK